MNSIRGQKRTLPQKKEVAINASIHNRFDIEVVDSQTGEVKQKAQAENVICQRLWTNLFNGTDYFQYLIYGSGTGTPASTDTSLFSYLGYLSPQTDDHHTDLNNKTMYRRRKFVLLETQAVGSSLTEIGISENYNYPCTHALLKDMNGNTISILKTNTDIVNIYATVYLDFSKIPSCFHVYGDATVFSGFLDGYFYSSKLPCSDGKPNDGKTGLGFGMPSPTKNVSTKTFTFKSSRVSADSCNAVGCGAQMLDGQECFIDLLDGVYTPSAIIGEAIGTGDGTNTKFKTAFCPIVPGTLKVYVDGVQTQDVTLTYSSIGLRKCMSNFYPDVFVQIDKNKNRLFPFVSMKTLTSSLYVENLRYTEIGLLGWSYGIVGGDTSWSCNVYASNDFVTWVKAGSFSQQSSSSTTLESDSILPEQYRRYRYYRLDGTGSYQGFWNFDGGVLCGLDQNYNIKFNTPPASGSVITADYTPNCVAKDANHVFDMTYVISLNEHTT